MLSLEHIQYWREQCCKKYIFESTQKSLFPGNSLAMEYLLRGHDCLQTLARVEIITREK